VSTNEYPLDTEGLGKGSRVTGDRIAEATGVPTSSRNFGLAMLRIKGYVYAALAERGLDVVIRQDGDDLVILTDSEAAPYTDDKFRQRIVQAGLALREQLSVARGGLTDEEVARHDRALTVNGMTYAGARKARRETLVATPRARLTPGS
jgi:hypothetical protein